MTANELLELLERDYRAEADKAKRKGMIWTWEMGVIIQKMADLGYGDVTVREADKRRQREFP